MLCHLLRLPRARVAGVGVGLFAPSPSSFFQEEGEEALAWAERETCVLPTLFLSLPLLGVGTMLFFPALSSIQAKGGGFFPQSFPCFEGLAHIAQLLCYLAPSLLAQPEG